jgi:ribonuclease Z
VSLPLRLRGASTALFSTWWFAENYGLLFDCGDGTSAALMHKARKVRHVFLSHADRDHIAGMLAFNQLYGGPKLTVHYPVDSGSFPPLAEFTRRFDPWIEGTVWRPIHDGECVPVGKGLSVRAMENSHIRGIRPGIRSLSYVVERSVRKLRPEFAGLPGAEIGAIRRERGEEAITDEIRSPALIYSADTGVIDDGRYDGAEVLIHEATFIDRADSSEDDPARFKHSVLEDVLAMVANVKPGHLVLGHFSGRYSAEQIEDAVREGCAAHGVTCPVSLVLPGEVSHDVLVRILT